MALVQEGPMKRGRKPLSSSKEKGPAKRPRLEFTMGWLEEGRLECWTMPQWNEAVENQVNQIRNAISKLDDLNKDGVMLKEMKMGLKSLQLVHATGNKVEIMSRMTTISEGFRCKAEALEKFLSVPISEEECELLLSSSDVGKTWKMLVDHRGQGEMEVEKGKNAEEADEDAELEMAVAVEEEEEEENNEDNEEEEVEVSIYMSFSLIFILMEDN
jgi:hypothetical protein